MNTRTTSEPGRSKALLLRRGTVAAGGVVALTVAALWIGLPSAQAATAVNLETAESYVVLAGSTVTNTGNSVLNGDLGVAPGTAITGFPPGIVVPPP